MFIFKIYDTTATLHWSLSYTPTEEPQFTTISGTQETWLWDLVAGALLRNGSRDLIDGGYSVTIERADQAV